MDNSFLPYQWTKEHLISVLTNPINPLLTEIIQIDAFRNIDRKNFVDSKFHDLAYSDVEIDIGSGQKINRPTIVAQQLSLIKPKEGGTYLEIGAGCGYLSSIIGDIIGPSGKVFAIERVLFLVEKMHDNLLKYPHLKNIVIPVFKDGSLGYEDQAPYDGIVISASFKDIPENLWKQLKIGGILIAPTTDYDIRVIERKSINELKETIHPGFVFEEIQTGIE